MPFSLAPLVASGQENERETLRLDEATTGDETPSVVDRYRWATFCSPYGGLLGRMHPHYAHADLLSHPGRWTSCGTPSAARFVARVALDRRDLETASARRQRACVHSGRLGGPFAAYVGECATDVVRSTRPHSRGWIDRRLCRSGPSHDRCAEVGDLRARESPTIARRS